MEATSESQLQALREMFDYTPPEQLYKTIQELFFNWLTENEDLPVNYKQMTEDVYFLLGFLERVKNGV
jgi:hypothetical protein